MEMSLTVTIKKFGYKILKAAGKGKFRNIKRKLL